MKWGGEDDYIEVILKAHPKTELSRFINAYKSAGSRLIKNAYPEVASKLEGVQFRSKSFLLMTLGKQNEVTTGKYQRSQIPGMDRRRRESRKTKEKQ